MTEKQKKFCQYYITSGSNATKAAKEAGYSEKTAYSQGQRLLKKVEVQEYIKFLVRPSERKRIASAEDVLTYLTSVLRREQQESVVVVTKESRSWINQHGKKETQTLETPKIVAIPSKLSDANKAAELLGKYMMLWEGAGKEKESNEILESLLALIKQNDTVF